jgi:hypothetical protein
MSFTLEEDSSPPAADTGTPQADAPQRRRGRPRSAPLEETAVGGHTAGGEKVKKPRRKKARKVDPAEVKELSQLIQFGHAMAHHATGLPELEISEFEADKLAGASAAMAAEFGGVVSGRTAVVMQFVLAVGLIYGPRFMKIKQRMNEAKKRAPIDAEVVPDSTMVPPAASATASTPA